MSISAQRFKFLDKETNISTKDFTELSDNLNYNVEELMNSSEMMDATETSTELLNALEGPKAELEKIALDESSNTSELVAQAFNDIKSMDLPEMSRNALDSIMETDQAGFMGFLQESLKIGSKVLCNNSEFLKMFLIGYSPHKNVASGLLLAFLLSMLDRYCNQFTQNERRYSSNNDMLYNLAPYNGVNMDSNNALSNFNNYYSDHLRSRQPLPPPAAAFNLNTFLTNVANSSDNLSVRNYVNALEEYEFNSTEKNSLILALDNETLNYATTTRAYHNLLYAKGEVRNLSSIRSDRRTRSIRYEHVNDNLGTMMRNVENTNLSGFQFQSLTGQDLAMFNALTSFQNTARTNNTASIRSNRSGSFNDIDFSTILPVLDPQVETNLLNSNIVTNSHRVYDLHPTSTVYT